MQVEESKKGGVLVVAAAGRLDAGAADEFQGRLSAAIERGETRILLDFSELTSLMLPGTSRADPWRRRPRQAPRSIRYLPSQQQVQPCAFSVSA
jgi:hypothetical protein